MLAVVCSRSDAHEKKPLPLPRVWQRYAAEARNTRQMLQPMRGRRTKDICVDSDRKRRDEKKKRRASRCACSVRVRRQQTLRRQQKNAQTPLPPEKRRYSPPPQRCRPAAFARHAVLQQTMPRAHSQPPYSNSACSFCCRQPRGCRARMPPNAARHALCYNVRPFSEGRRGRKREAGAGHAIPCRGFRRVEKGTSANASAESGCGMRHNCTRFRA